MNKNAPKNPILERITIPTVEDVVDYRIYIWPLPDSISAYQSRLGAILEYVDKEIVKDYIWQEEPFSLTLVEGLESSSLEPAIPVSNTTLPPGHSFHFFGSTRFGDSIEDEWFIVHILQSISRKFSDIFISVVDSDGDFLLIEAAMHIPHWLKPETAVHRVWIAQSGEFHIIPITLVPHIGSTHSLAIQNALSTISSSPEKTKVEALVSKSITDRISTSLASNQPQWSACTVPVNVAYILKHKPEWIAKAITEFYHRDPISQKSAQRFDRVGTGPKVNVMVRMTRCLYAQVSSQHWIPPRSYGIAVDTPNNPLLVHKFAFDLGAKITLGFEILYQQELQRRNRIASSQAISTYPFAKDIGWISYLDKLKSIGYFRGLPETHFKAIELEKRAKQKYLTLHPDKASSSLPPSLITEFDQILGNFEKSLGNSNLTDSKMAASLFPDSDLFPSTSTEWMNISPEEVDRILFERQMEQEQLFHDRSGLGTSNNSNKTSSQRTDLQSANDSTSNAATSSSDANHEEESSSHRKPDLFDRMVQDIEKFLIMKSGLDGVDLSEENPQRIPKRDKTTVRQNSGFPDSSEAFEAKDESDSDEFYETDSDEDRVDLEDLEDVEEGESTSEWPPANSSDVDAENAQSDRIAMLELMREMDAQLLDTELAKSFERKSKGAGSVYINSHGPGQEENDSFVDENINLVKNFIESYAAQNGVAGPVSTLLSQLDDWRRKNEIDDNCE